MVERLSYQWIIEWLDIIHDAQERRSQYRCFDRLATSVLNRCQLVLRNAVDQVSRAGREVRNPGRRFWHESKSHLLCQRLTFWASGKIRGIALQQDVVAGFAGNEREGSRSNWRRFECVGRRILRKQDHPDGQLGRQPRRRCTGHDPRREIVNDLHLLDDLEASRSWAFGFLDVHNASLDGIR
jgi:hypothetical protein